jgi:histidinol-phosphate phosphatase family protein
MKNKPVIFLDRDGTILDEKGYLTDPQKIHFYPTALVGLKKLIRNGWRFIVITNQSAVGRGYITHSQLRKINSVFRKRLQQKGIYIADILYCPHLPNAGCSCRKPQIGLPLRAKRKYKINFKTSYVVGDQDRDIKMAKRLGAKGVLVLTGAGAKNREKMKKIAHKVTSNMKTASEWIVEDSHR